MKLDRKKIKILKIVGYISLVIFMLWGIKTHPEIIKLIPLIHL